MEALHRNNTWVLADLSVGKKVIGCKWIFKIKYKASGEIDRYKARLVAKGFSKRESQDYEETFCHVGDLHEEMYMYLPPGNYDKNEPKFCKLVKCFKNDYSLYVKSKKVLFIALLLYVDDTVITGNDKIENFKQFLRKYCLELLSEYDLLACKHAATPLQQNTIFYVKESKNDKYIANMLEYQKLVRKLIYLSVTRPDIAYVVHYSSQHMHAPLHSNFTAHLRVLRCLKQALGFLGSFFVLWFMANDRQRNFSTYEDLTQKVSQSIFVTNFSESVTPRDFWRVCGTYGTVVDVFIPVKRSKAGKRFAFVRFIKVINLDRLVKNLCTLWIGNYHLYANQVRFERPRINQFPPLNESSRVSENQGLRQPHGSYAKVVNAISPMVNASPFVTPLFVKKTSRRNLGEASNDFVSDERIVWLDIEGVPLHAWSRETFSRIAKKWGETLNIEDTTDHSFGRKLYSSDDDSVQADNENDVHPCDNDVEGGDDNVLTDDGVAETVFDTGDIGEQHSVDPFELYGLLNKRKQAEEVNVLSSSFSHPPSITLVGSVDLKANEHVNKEGDGRQEDVVSPVVNAKVMNISQDVEEEVSCASVKTGGSVLGVLEEVIRVGQEMGFSMERCEKDVENIIGNQGDETRFSREFRGILCIWEMSVFRKDHVTISDSFIAIYGTWLPSNSKLLLVSIYAPQQTAYKRVLWEYMSILLGRWNGDAILMGDFNELQDIKSREAADFIQKSKVRWAIEGDENSKYFHEIINKKQSQLAIRGVFVDDQAEDLERLVTRDEIRRPVWSCGENKSPGSGWFHFRIFQEILGYGRLASVIADIVSVTQSPFITDRQILDGPFILNEVIHWCKRLNKKAMFFKVDFAKVYDSVRWDYLLDVLEAFGFGSIWCKWIRGDGLFYGIRLNRSPVLTHLFYADNALFIGEWSEGNLRGIVNILKCFFLASGMQINILKSQVMGVGVPLSMVVEAASSIGCSIMQNQFKYLGVQVGECMSRSKAWDGIILKLRSRLSKWKAKTLSIGGRFTQLKSVLGASPLYTMSIFKAPLG
nr:hypothetical protein [Tanacetum cinerariifolium]